MPAGRTRYAYIVSFFSSRVGRFCRAVEFGVVWKGDLWGRYLQQMVGMLDVGKLVEGRDVYGRLGSGCGGCEAGSLEVWCPFGGAVCYPDPRAT